MDKKLIWKNLLNTFKLYPVSLIIYLLLDIILTYFFKGNHFTLEELTVMPWMVTVIGQNLNWTRLNTSRDRENRLPFFATIVNIFVYQIVAFLIIFPISGIFMIFGKVIAKDFSLSEALRKSIIFSAVIVVMSLLFFFYEYYKQNRKKRKQ